MKSSKKQPSYVGFGANKKAQQYYEFGYGNRIVRLSEMFMGINGIDQISFVEIKNRNVGIYS